jgi:integral membrane protein
MSAALTRYRVVAYVVGVVLVLFILVAMPLKYFADSPGFVAVIAPVHGFLYMIYLVVTFDLSMRARWPLSRTILLLLAGTVPFVSFVAERWVTAQIRSRAEETAAV